MTKFTKLSLFLLGTLIVGLTTLLVFYYVNEYNHKDDLPVEASYVDAENEVIPKNASYYGEDFLPFIGE